MIYLTGKGGAGKSMLATLLAQRCAEQGVRTALIETGSPGGPRRDSAEKAYSLFRLDERTALGQMVTRLLRVRFLAARLMDSRTFSAVAAAAPGVRELVYLSYIFDVARGHIAPAGNRRATPPDIVFVDGFATGHSVELLSSPYTSAELIPIGPAARIARDIGRAARDADGFRVVSVTLPEELAATETAELQGALNEIGVRIAATVVNRVYPDRFDRCEDGREAALEWLHARHAAGEPGSSDARLYERRRVRQREIVEGLRTLATGSEFLEVAHQFDGNGSQTPRETIDALLKGCLDGITNTENAE